MKDISLDSIKPEYHIAIVGGGPAGSTFARIAGKMGVSILMVDGQNEGKRKPCGGLLAPDAQKLMASYDFTLPKDVLVDPQIFSVKTMDLVSGITRSYQRYYLNMDRYKFDELLQSMVPDEVERVKAVAKTLKRSDDGRGFEILLEGAGSHDQKSVRAKFIVGADGGSSTVRRTFFKTPILKYIAIQQWFRYHEPENLYYSCIFDRKTSESCSWVIHKDEYIIFGGCFEKKGGREAFEEQKKRLMTFTGIDLSNPEFTEACLACRPRRMKDFVMGSDGVFLVGEAAGFISASSLEGISFAMRSGELLAEAFMEAGEGSVEKLYRRKTRGLRFKLMTKVVKHDILFSPFLRKLIMRSGVQSIKEKD